MGLYEDLLVSSCSPQESDAENTREVTTRVPRDAGWDSFRIVLRSSCIYVYLLAHPWQREARQSIENLSDLVVRTRTGTVSVQDELLNALIARISDPYIPVAVEAHTLWI